MGRKRNSPRLGGAWKYIGLIDVSDVDYVTAAMKKHKIAMKITSNHHHEKDDPKQKLYKELYVATGYRRDAMKLMRFLFKEPR